MLNCANTDKQHQICLALGYYPSCNCRHIKHNVQSFAVIKCNQNEKMAHEWFSWVSTCECQGTEYIAVA